MKTSTKKQYVYKLITISVLVIAILVSSLILISSIINRNRYKDYISNKFANYYAGQLILAGPIKVEIFPKLHVVVNGIIIKNPPQFLQTQNFIQINTIDVTIKLIPLIKGNINLDNVIISGVQVDLKRRERDNNWTLKNYNNNSKNKIVLNKLSIENMRINYYESNIIESTEILNILVNQNSGQIKIDKATLELNNITMNINNIINLKANGIIYYATSMKYKGSLLIADTDLSNSLHLIHINLPDKFRKKAFSHVTINSTVNGNSHQFDISKINLLINKTSIHGNVSIQFYPFKVTENLKFSSTDIADYINLNGFSLKFESALLSGNIRHDESKNINGIQNLNINNITLYGFNLKSLIFNLNKALDSLNGLNTLITATQVNSSVNKVRDEVNKLSENKQKSLSAATILGNLNTQIIVKYGVVTTPLCQSTGQDIKISCNGIVNIPKNSVDYKFNILVAAPSRHKFINNVYFPYHLTGKLSDIEASIDWGDTIKQTIAYFNKHKEEKPALSKTFDMVRNYINPESASK